jgi:hypothetical protein
VGGQQRCGAGPDGDYRHCGAARVNIKLDFMAPFQAHNRLLADAARRRDESRLDDGGPGPYVMKVMSVFTDMDAMIGKDVETGLASLKAVAEK